MGRLKNLELSRPVFSYSAVQAATGNLIRNRGFQIRRPRVRALTYIDIGAGLNTHSDFINVDFLWHPKIDLCWDITKGLPFPDQSMDGVFSEHCLEHFPLDTAKAILQECRRVLRPGGTLRIVVPDAELYLRTYVRRLDGDSSVAFPYENGGATPLSHVNRVFYQDRASPYGHCCMYDFALLRATLEQTGFRNARRVSFRQGADTTLLIDAESRACESIYVEAS